MLLGLFIGIDRYRPPVPRLSCAVNDALALAGLFEDTLGGNVRRLLDDDATADHIRSALAALEGSDPDDLVIITFSGHGTEDHRLVPVDVDPADVAGSCIALTELAEAVDRIPARNLL